MKNGKIYFCRECGCMLDSLNDSERTLSCCGKEMKELLPGTKEGAKEKHVPIVSINQNSVTVTVGETKHPMTEEHLIEWIYLKTDKGRYIRFLSISDEPAYTFTLKDERPLEASAFCNSHGLWKATF